jgi:hypothetical protein
MGTDIKTLENNLRAFVETISGRDCYIQEQMGPVPADPYCTIYNKQIEFPQYDVVNYEFIDPDCFIKVRGQAIITFAISAWGGPAHECMTISNKIRNALQVDTRYLDLWPIAGLGQMTPILSIPEEYEGERRQRTEFDLSLHTALTETFLVDYFDKTDIDINANGQNISFTIDQIAPSCPWDP